MAISNMEEKNKRIEEELKSKEAEKVHSDAISKLYKNKKQIDNSHNTKR